METPISLIRQTFVVWTSFKSTCISVFRSTSLLKLEITGSLMSICYSKLYSLAGPHSFECFSLLFRKRFNIFIFISLQKMFLIGFRFTVYKYLIGFFVQRGWATSSSNIKYSPSPTTYIYIQLHINTIKVDMFTLCIR